jgi:hypothetical protein
MIYPYAPFVGEEMYLSLPSHKASVCLESYPEFEKEYVSPKAVAAFRLLEGMIKDIRNFKSEKSLAPNAPVKLVVTPKEPFKGFGDYPPALLLRGVRPIARSPRRPSVPLRRPFPLRRGSHRPDGIEGQTLGRAKEPPVRGRTRQEDAGQPRFRLEGPRGEDSARERETRQKRRLVGRRRGEVGVFKISRQY